MTATKTSSKVQRGGARPGSGRPRTDRTRRNIAITEDMYTLAKQIGQRINALGGVTSDEETTEIGAARGWWWRILYGPSTRQTVGNGARRGHCADGQCR